MLGFRSALPKVTLTKAFSTPFDNAIATARTCYSSRIIYDEDVRKDEKAIALRDDIARSTYLAGHHTTLQHAHFQFSFENVSRQALWSFFHAHPFYNSEQVSQRYVEVKPDRVLIPKLGSTTAQERYESAVQRQIAVYQELLTLLLPAAEDAYFSVYKARLKNKDDKRWRGAIKKRCQEVARYVLPIATHAHMYHTISGLTLHRYNRMAETYDCPSEQRLIIDAMVQAVNEQDPLFFRDVEKVIPLDFTHDARILHPYLNGEQPHDPSDFIASFDQALEGKTAKLLSITPQAIELIGTSIRQMFALSPAQLCDADALKLVLDPSQNRYLGEALNLNTLGKATRALELVTLAFSKKISHTADSQAQRHRMIPGTRPLLFTHVVPGKPDYITPLLFSHPLAENAKRIYDEEMTRIFNDIAALVEEKVSPEAWQYLLPNAFPVRYIDSASLLDHHHKWTSRLCYNAQEEIWHASLDEVKQVEAVFPEIGRWLLPPCGLRANAKATPVCPEGIRYCGTPVWRLEKNQYLRVL